MLAKQHVVLAACLCAWINASAMECDPGAFLEIDGEVSTPLKMTQEQFMRLRLYHISTDTNWSQSATQDFAGPRLSDVLRLAGTRPEAKTLMLRAVNGYSISIDYAVVTKYEPVLSHTIDGKLHDRQRYGPIWLILPRRQHPELVSSRGDAMSIWGLCRITVRK